MKTIREIILEIVNRTKNTIGLDWFDNVDISTSGLSISDPGLHDYESLNDVEFNDSISYLEQSLIEISKLPAGVDKDILHLIRVLRISLRIIELYNYSGTDFDQTYILKNRILSKIMLPVSLFRNGVNEFSSLIDISTTTTDDVLLGLQCDSGIENANFDLYLANEQNPDNLLSLLVLIEKDSFECSILVSSPSFIPANKINTFFYYSYVHSGGSFINPALRIKSIPASGYTKVLPLYDQSIDYKQFHEVLGVLEDGNHENFILDRFLKLYQVIENFMFRKPITGFVNTVGADRFTIRKFRALYNEVDTTDGKALKKFLCDFLDDETFTTTGIKEKFTQKAKRMIEANLTNDDLDDVCSFMGHDFATGHAHLKSLISSKDSLASLIYKIRNSIVHNKETEIHISNSMVQNNCPAIFKFVDVMCEFQFVCIQYILTERNNFIKYDKNHLPMYDLNDRI